MLKPQLLDTTAFIYYKAEEYFTFYYEHITDDPNEHFSFIANLYPNENYILYLFVKVNCLNEEKYYSINTEINTKDDDDDNDKKIKEIIIFSCFIGVFLITIIISIVVCTKYSKKNKSLKEEIKKISFCKGIDGENSEENKRERNFSEITVI